VQRAIFILIVSISSAVAAPADDPKPKRPSGKATSKPTSAPTTQGPPRKVRVGEIDKGMIGRLVSVTATVDQVAARPSKTREKIYIVTLIDGDDRIALVYWQDLAKTMTPDQVPVESDRVRVIGTVTEYRNHLEIVLNDPGDIHKLKPKAK